MVYMEKIFTRFFDTKYWRERCNTAELKYVELEESVKNGIFDRVLSNTNVEEQKKNLKVENKNLRKKIKVLKEIIKNGE